MSRAIGLVVVLVLVGTAYSLLAHHVIGTRPREYRPDPDLRDACERWQARERKKQRHA